ncbi:MAG TPA: fructose PTS transporter subunit IIA [Euzebyales bacterium]
MDLTIDDVITPDLIILELESNARDDAIREMADRLVAQGRVGDRSQFVDAVLKREAEGGGTGMEMGVAIPHAKSEAVNNASVAFARSGEGIDFGGDSEQPSGLIFLIAAPAGGDDLHIRLLARLSRRLIHESFRQKLHDASSEDEVMQIFREEVTL